MDVLITRRGDGPIEAYVPDRPDVHATGRDMDELRQNLQAAVAQHPSAPHEARPPPHADAAAPV